MDTLIAADQLAPDFSLPDLSGKLHRLADYRGGIVVLNFWSADCPHAARVDSALLELLKAWPGAASLISIASNTNETREQWRQAAQGHGLPLVLLDAGHGVADQYGAVTTPHLFLIDAGGLLRYQGALDNVTFRQLRPTRSYLHEALQALLAGRSPEPANTPAYGCALVRY
jgi:peroxiredoxin